MELERIQDCVRDGKFLVSAHADQEAADEEIDIAEIREAILNGEILERYSDTGRGPSCLIVGWAGKRPIHIVCGWRRGSVIIVTVYLPTPSKFVDPWTRRRL